MKKGITIHNPIGGRTCAAAPPHIPFRGHSAERKSHPRLKKAPCPPTSSNPFQPNPPGYAGTFPRPVRHNLGGGSLGDVAHLIQRSKFSVRCFPPLPPRLGNREPACALIPAHSGRGVSPVSSFRILPSAFVLLFLLATAIRGFSAALPSLPHDAYVWQRAWNDSVVEAVTNHGPAFSNLVVLKAEVTWRNSKPDIAPAHVDYAALAATHRPIGIALRIGAFSGPFSTNDKTTTFLSPTRHNTPHRSAF